MVGLLVSLMSTTVLCGKIIPTNLSSNYCTVVKGYVRWLDLVTVGEVTIIDLIGSWSVANLATDYTIKHTSNNTLQVSLLSDGDFKINYQNAV